MCFFLPRRPAAHIFLARGPLAAALQQRPLGAACDIITCIVVVRSVEHSREQQQRLSVEGAASGTQHPSRRGPSSARPARALGRGTGTRARELL